MTPITRSYIPLAFPVPFDSTQDLSYTEDLPVGAWSLRWQVGIGAGFLGILRSVSFYPIHGGAAYTCQLGFFVNRAGFGPNICVLFYSMAPPLLSGTAPHVAPDLPLPPGSILQFYGANSGAGPRPVGLYIAIDVVQL